MNTKDKTAQHMPGPLLTLREKDDRSEAACGCHAIRNVLGHVRMVQCHIHTAAPELLAAVQRAAEVLGAFGGGKDLTRDGARRIADDFRAAISKATKE